uniref:ATP/GTP binding protein 1 n=1 Tax=Eptatretus burgeri TaxID=7764 RepID=A0A8C4QDU9_EPTBU
MTDSAQSKGLSRVAGMLAQLQDCWTLPNPVADERARYLTTRLLQLTRTEKARKEMSKQGSSGMDVILSTLQNTKDNQVIEGVLNIVLDLLTAPGSSLRARHLVMKGGSAVLLQTLMKLSQESLPCSESLILLHLILSKIGHKDKKFASKARTCGALSVTLSLFQRNIYNHCLSLPCLRVIKLYAACVLNATLMGKNGAIKTLFSLIGPFAGKYNALLKTVLETLGALLKSKTNVRQAVDHGNVRKLLDAYQDWHRHDVKHIHIAIRSGMLVCIKYITSINVGRVAFNDADGTEILYTTAQECLSNQALDRVVNLSTIIMRKCYPKNRLPLPTILSSIHFPLPTGASTCNADEEPEDGNEDSDEASSEQEVEPDDGTDIQEKDEDIETDLRNLRVQPKLDRSEEDLKVYQEFFSELFQDFQHLDKLEERGVCDIRLGNSLHTVTVPTAARDAYDHECAQTKTPYLGGMCQQPHETSSGERLEHILNVLDTCSLQESQNGDDVSNSFVIKEKVLDDPTGHHKVKHLTPPCRDTGILDGDMHELSQLPGRCKETIERCYGHEDGTIMKWLLKCGRELPYHALQYAALAKNTKSVMDYSETAFPDFFGHTVPIEKEPLMQRQYGVQRSKIFKDIERLLFPEDVIDKVVYDLDNPGSLAHSEDALIFSSKFESGNLRKAIQIRKHEYDLITNSDINTTRHHLWFYFKVSNMECNVPYRLNLVNCEKVNSQFNFGMQPVMYSMQNALQEQQGWTRIGTDICYYRYTSQVTQ